MTSRSSSTADSVEPPAYHGSPRASRGQRTREATPTASGSSTTSAKRPSSAPVLALALASARSPISTGPTVAAAISDPASAPSASAASPPARATSPTAATSVEDSPSVSTPSRTGLSNSRLIAQASGTSTANGASDKASTACQRLRSSHSSCGAIPSAVSATSAASTRSPRSATCSEGSSSATATASRAKGSIASAIRSARRAPVIGVQSGRAEAGDRVGAPRGGDACFAHGGCCGKLRPVRPRRPSVQGAPSRASRRSPRRRFRSVRRSPWLGRYSPAPTRVRS